MMGWLITLGSLVLLGSLPLGIRARYDSKGPLVQLLVGAVRIQLFPKKKQGDKPEPAKAVPKEQPKQKTGSSPKTEPKTQSTAPKTKPISAPQAPRQESSKGGNPKDLLPLIPVILDFLRDLGRKLRVSRLGLNLVMAGEDPCNLAENYARAWAALGNLWPRLEELFVIKKRNVQVQCDFEASQTLITAEADITITLARLLGLVVRYGLRALTQYRNNSNKRKGGAKI